MTTQQPLSIDDVLDELTGGPAEPRQELPEVEVIAEGQEPEQKEEPSKKEPEKPKDDPVAKMKRELAELRAREEAARKEREQYAKLAAQKAMDAQRAMARAQTSDYDLISNALESATDKMATLEQQFAAASEAMDWGKAAAIQRQMSILGSRITQLEDGKARLEQQAQLQRQRAAQMQARQQQQPRPQPQQNVDPFEAAISGFSEPSKNWIREHREYATPEKWGEVVAAHHYATKKLKLQEDTPEYFEAIEKELGIREADPEPPKQPVQPRKSLPAAPVSRGNGSSGKEQVRLSPRLQQVAKDMGLTNEEYAVGMKIREQKQAQMRVH